MTLVHTKYQGSRPCGFRQEDFFTFSLFKTFYPQGGAIFDPRGIIWTYFVEVHKVMLNTKYQGSWPCGFRQKDFFTFSLCKTFYPRGGAIFDPRGIIWTHFVEVHYVMLHTKYQGSRPYGFRQVFFTFSLYKPM